MRTDRLTAKFQDALSDAQSLAVGRDHQFIEPIHIVVAMMSQDGGSIRPLFTSAGINVNQLANSLNQALEQLPGVEGVGGDVQVSNGLNRLFNITDKLAQKRKDQFISSELFILAALEVSDTLTDLLKQAGATKDNITQAIDAVRGGQTVDDANAEDQRQMLERFTIDLTERAEQGKLDPVIGSANFVISTNHRV